MRAVWQGDWERAVVRVWVADAECWMHQHGRKEGEGGKGDFRENLARFFGGAVFFVFVVVVLV